MTYEHQRWENRVFLYGYMGALSTTRVDEYEGKQRTHAGGALRVTEHLPSNSKPVSSVWWVKGYWSMAEWMILKIKHPVWMGLEGRLRVYNGRSMNAYIDGRSRVYIEILRCWIEAADGRRDATVVCSREEWDRLKGYEAAVMSGDPKLRFKVPLDIQKELDKFETFSTADDPNYIHDIGDGGFGANGTMADQNPGSTLKHRGPSRRPKPPGQRPKSP